MSDKLPNYTELLPAYGRDYKSGKAAKEDFLAGKDFRTPFGLYTSIRDAVVGNTVLLRFKKQTGVTSVVITKATQN